MADTDYAALVKAWGELRDSAIWAAVVVGVVVAICFVIYCVIQYKKSKSAQDSKNVRAIKITSSNEKTNEKIDLLNKSVAKLTVILEAHKKEEEETVWPALNVLKSNVQDLTYKVTGTTGIHDSLNIIRLVFFKVIYYEICEHLNELLSIKESDFKFREQFIANNFRTNIGDVLSKYKSSLSDFKLSINSNVFFKLDSTESIERFILVDIIWSEIKEHLISQLKYEQKTEECSLKLRNILKDYINAIITEMNEENSIKRDIESKCH